MVDIAIEAIAPQLDAILSAYNEAHEVMQYPGVVGWKRCAAPTMMGANPANRGNIIYIYRLHDV